jgi:hypothetical protein
MLILAIPHFYQSFGLRPPEAARPIAPKQGVVTNFVGGEQRPCLKVLLPCVSRLRERAFT